MINTAGHCSVCHTDIPADQHHACGGSPTPCGPACGTKLYSGATYDYDNAPTHPVHGGKLTAEQAGQRIAELENALRNLVMLERTFAPDHERPLGRWAAMQNGKILAQCLDHARELLGMEPPSPPSDDRTDAK